LQRTVEADVRQRRNAVIGFLQRRRAKPDRVEIAARFGEVKPWSKMASRGYPLEEVAAALTAVENRSAVKAVVRI